MGCQQIPVTKFYKENIKQKQIFEEKLIHLRNKYLLDSFTLSLTVHLI
jgi:hypothetical protein